MRLLFDYVTAGLLIASSITANADAGAPPQIMEVNLEGNGTFYNISDNGLWIVGDAHNPNNSSLTSYATLVNALTGEKTPIWNLADDSQQSGARDVTDNGDVAGWYDGKAAIYRRESGKWITLPQPRGNFVTVALYSITPDGEYAVGEGMTESWQITPVAYHITGDNAEMLDLGNCGAKRMQKVLPGGLVPVDNGLYDLKTGETKVIEGGMAGQYMYSPDGHWMIRGARDEDDQPAYGPYQLVDLFTGEVHDVADNSGGSSVYADGVDNNGLLYGCSEHDLMFRSWHVHVGKYWYDIRTILRQLYGIDWATQYAKTDEGLSGTFWATSGDGKTVISADYTKSPTANYIFRMDKPFGELCGSINLLDNYYMTPVNGASFSRLSNMSVTFDRPVSIIGEASSVSLEDSDGNVIRNSIAFSISAGSENSVNIVFRNTTLEEGKSYNVVIPAGVIAVKGDEERTNSEIRVSYKGRPNEPVRPVSISPADGNEVPRINLTSNPVILDFDTDVTACENPDNERRLSLYIVEDGNEHLITQLNGSINGRQVLLYPINEQRLAEGSDYRVVVSAGTFADLSGANPNEEIVINYKGSYTPEPPANEKVIFSDDFNQGISTAKWMFFEGDGNVPAQEPASWDFTADTTPWYFVRDSNESVDWAACSHSMYSPAGQSDDWMVTQRLYIADDSYVLRYKSQSYRNDKEDVLKVYVWASDDVVTALTPAIVNSMRYAGALICNERQNPGKSEPDLAGDWTENEISLAQFAGRNIYIAFVNDNYNQSAIFMDDIEVSRDLALSMQLFTPEFVVDTDEVEISGRLQNLSGEVVDSLRLTLLDAEGNKVDEIEANDVNLEPDGLYPFSFSRKLALPTGIETYFTVTLDAAGKETSMRSSVKNLAFQTTRRVVLEEMTGTSCQFCPQGHVVIEKLEDEFGDRFIPIAIHSYTGGTFYSDEAAEYSQFLGLSAAPTAVIDRMYLASPLNADYEMIDPAGSRLWYDIVAERLGTFADADIELSKAYIDEDNNKFEVEAKVRYAYNASNLNVNLFTVVMEDGMQARQSNAFVNATAPIMAEWEVGGPYGSPNAHYTYTNVMRGTVGSTFNGTGGFIPSNVVAGEEYTANISFDVPMAVSVNANTKVAVVMIDANTGRVINAAAVKSSPSGVDEIEGSASDVMMKISDGRINLAADGAFSAAAYAADGTMLASVEGDGEISLDLRGNTGVVILRTVKDNVSKAVKIIVR